MVTYTYSTLKSIGFRVVHMLPKKLSCLIKDDKDFLHNTQKSNVVYQIDCMDCDMKYIGQTKRCVKTRMMEHITTLRSMRVCNQ